MGWIYRVPDEPKPHKCDVPRKETGDLWYTADANPGSIWSCDNCGRLWEVVQGRRSYYPDWFPVSWGTRRRLKKQGIWTGKEELVHDGVSNDRPGSA